MRVTLLRIVTVFDFGIGGRDFISSGEAGARSGPFPGSDAIAIPAAVFAGKTDDNKGVDRGIS